ncbi:MAG: hypothetical protein OXG37_16530 [Actinomycetia bacterium]|nr:hypothetical protein [Actinomycetes bacterium]
MVAERVPDLCRRWLEESAELGRIAGDDAEYRSVDGLDRLQHDLVGQVGRLRSLLRRLQERHPSYQPTREDMERDGG